MTLSPPIRKYPERRMRWSIENKTATDLALAGLILVIVCSALISEREWIHQN